jgi:HD-GYP domain-containing protein (c-di-GMP phosphodiesterase class II)
MTKDRPYSDAIAVADALAEVRRCAATHFNPEVAQTFCALIERPPVAAERAGTTPALAQPL